MLVDPIVLLAFLPAALALNLTPGADMMFCFGQGLRHGFRAALGANFGIAAGAYLQTIIAGFGLGALVSAWPIAFDIIRWVGVAYLLLLAWKALFSRPLGRHMADTMNAFRDGLIVNLTNPKVILFTLAFIPQFVDPLRGSVLLQFMLFGAILSIGGLVVNGVVGVFAGGVGQQLARSPVFSRAIGFVSASVFIALALRLTVWERS